MASNHDILNLDILPAPQRRLWDELSQVPEAFTLYGGTAIALRLGHRQSVDFDFFSLQDINIDSMLHNISWTAEASILQSEPNTLTLLVDRGGPVRVSFFGLPRLKNILPPRRLEAPSVNLARLLDLSGMKMAVIQQRAEAKDYLDIHAIWTLTDITPEQSLAAASVIYGGRINPYDTLKALSYFGESGLEQLPDKLKARLTEAAKAFDFHKMRRYQAEYEALAS